MGHCDFCAIVEGTEKAHIVYRSEDAIAFFPRKPVGRGHTLVVPVTHIANFLAAPDSAASRLAASCRTVGAALQDALRPEGMNLITSAGEAATQSVFHLHYHLVPRWKGDRMGDFWPGGEDASDDAQEALATRIREELARP
ncbi:histidine triad (HIT) family protein [Arthrobacter sp. ov118]|nr:histidine triad (HIT) family protein [Arthrobacter sp. ov118]